MYYIWLVLFIPVHCASVIETIRSKINKNEWSELYLDHLNRGDLNCNLNRPCCWRNGNEDRFEIGDGKLEARLFKKKLRGYKQPEGKYYYAISQDTANPYFEAKLVSCPLLCTRTATQMILQYWTTEGVELKICIQDAFLADPQLINCVEIDPRRSPGPTVSVLLPAGELFEIVILAKNERNKNSGAAIIDNIRIIFSSCRRIKPPKD